MIMNCPKLKTILFFTTSLGKAILEWSILSWMIQRYLFWIGWIQFSKCDKKCLHDSWWMMWFRNFISCSFAPTLFLPTLDIKSFNDSQIVQLAKVESCFFTSTFKWYFFLKRLIRYSSNAYLSIDLESTRQSTNKLNTLNSLSFTFTIENICKSPILFIWGGITSTHLIIKIWHIYVWLHIFSFIHYFMLIDNYWDLVSSIVNFLFSNNCSFFWHFPIFLKLISQLFLVTSEFFSS
jgi:hypothetical protein